MAEKMDIKYVDLRKVPREIVFVALHVHGKKRLNNPCEGENIKWFNDEFKELFNSDLKERVKSEKKRVMDDFKHREMMTLHDFDFSNENCKREFMSHYEQAAYWIAYYDETLVRQQNAYKLISSFMENNKEDFDNGKPIVIKVAELGNLPKFIVSKGNVIKCYKTEYIEEVVAKPIYTDVDCGKVLGEFIAKLYPQNEQPVEQE